VAEALAPVPDPIVTALRPGEWRRAAEVARGMARRLAPDEEQDAAPAWLRPEQMRSFRRALHTLRQHGGALLADAVGSGKTYVALAVAAVLEPHRPAVCLVPATLLAQWRATADTLGVRIVAATHQAASRGRLPDTRRGLVIVDEAHHFRNPATWRYRHTAPWLVGRRVLLVTATPVVNRLSDLLHQLLLGIRDDALAAEGVVSLRALLGGGQGSPALGKLVVDSAPAEGHRPARSHAVSRADAAESSAAQVTLASLDRLRLSRLPGTEALVRTVLRRAAVSSPAALSAALRRYRSLLLHARDAASAGRPLDRAALRRFAGELEDQLVWWELMPSTDDPNDLSLDDLDAIGEVLCESARAEESRDGKVERLRILLADGRPTLVFTSRRETVRYLRDRLAPPPLAWCTGARAGLGSWPLPRATVLGWFREAGRSGMAPMARHLIATDVAAEGLDLQRAARIVHYDLPWTPMRLEQREGRAARLGSPNAAVEVVTFSPPTPMDRALRMTRALALKAHLPSLVGLGPAGRGLWRWRSELAELYAAGPASTGVGIVPAGPAGVLALFELHAVRAEGAERLSATLVWVDPDGTWTEEESIVAARLAVSAASPPAPGTEPTQLKAALGLLAEPLVTTGGRPRRPSALAEAAPRGTGGGEKAGPRGAGRTREGARVRRAGAHGGGVARIGAACRSAGRPTVPGGEPVAGRAEPLEHDRAPARRRAALYSELIGTQAATRSDRLLSCLPFAPCSSISTARSSTRSA
jgi:superfamily II DNA or RNA helicase